MERIASFSVDHTKLLPGLYVSRKDERGGVTVTTFDLRVTAPDREPVMTTACAHTIEHLGATFLRNSAAAADVVYFGPMGCRTGFYLLMFGDLAPAAVLPLVRETFAFIASYDGPIPGASPAECGNYVDQDLPAARECAAKYLRELGGRADGVYRKLTKYQI